MPGGACPGAYVRPPVARNRIFSRRCELEGSDGEVMGVIWTASSSAEAGLEASSRHTENNVTFRTVGADF